MRSTWFRIYLPDVPGAVHDYVFLNHNDPVWDTQWAIPAHELLDQYLILNSGFDCNGTSWRGLSSTAVLRGEGGVPYRGNIGLRWVHTQQTGLGYAEILDGSELRYNAPYLRRLAAQL